MTVLCSVKGCPKRVDGHGLCSAHLKRKHQYGDPLGGPPMRSRNGEPLKSLLAACAATTEECILWPHARNGAGYAHLKINGKYFLAHRLVCEAVNGAPPDEDSEAAHQCGNGALGCINGNHLSWKSRQGNAQDMVAHGRSQRGRRHYLAKLTEDRVRAIRSNPANLTAKQFASHFGVSVAAIHAVRKRISWAWVEDDAFGTERGVVWSEPAQEQAA